MHPSMVLWVFFFFSFWSPPSLSFSFYQSIFIKLLSWKDL